MTNSNETSDKKQEMPDMSALLAGMQNMIGNMSMPQNEQKSRPKSAKGKINSKV